MLRGFYRVGKLRFDLRGYDRLTQYQFYLRCDPKIQKYIDKGYTYTDDMGDEIKVPSAVLWKDLYMTISEDSISVAKYKHDSIRGVQNELEQGFFKTLGILLTGSRMLCTKESTVGYTEAFGLDTNPDAIQAHIIQNVVPPNKKNPLTYKIYVERKFGRILSIHMGTDKTPYQLILEEDEDFSEILKKTTSTMHKIKFDLSMCFKDLKPKAKVDKKAIENQELLDVLLSWDEIQERHPERNYRWLRDRDYKIITTKKEMEKVCDEIMNHDGIVAFDTETTGLNFTFEGLQGMGDKLVGMVFSIKEGQAWYFPVRHKAFPNICTELDEYSVINQYFKPILEQKKILCHNASFDMKVMFRYGIRLNLVEDTMIILRLSLSLENKNAPYSLKGATRNYLNRDSYELEDLVSVGKWLFNFAELPYEYVRMYACADTDNTLALYHWLKRNKIFEKYDLYNIYYNVELPFTSVVAYSEYFGMMVDMSRAEELDKKLHEACDAEKIKIYECAGHEFNVDSPKELVEVLYNGMGCPVVEQTNKGEPSTGKDALKKLASMTTGDGEPRYPIVKHLKAYKDSNKLITSFTNLLNGKSKSDNNISASGVISSSVQPLLETSRVSVNKPNYQSFNDTVKQYIIPRQGYYMIDADYSSVEYRITASMSGQKELIEAFFDPDTDYHKLKASLMFQIPYEDVSSEMRRMAKSFNFGIPYGMALPALAELLYGNKDPDSIAKAGVLYEKYFEGQDNVRKFFEDGRAEGWLLGRSRTYFGGYRYYDKTAKSKSKIERESGNHKIQGTAANIYKMAMADFYRKICEKGWWGKVLISGFIHDECLIEASCDINPAIVMYELRDSMMLDIEGWCPLYTGMGCGNCWDDAKHIEIPVQVQEDLLGKYGKTGFPWWKGDPKELYSNMKQFIYDYKRDRVLKYLENPENKGTVLPLVENDLAHEVISAVHAGKYTNGVVDTTPDLSHDILENLKNFCKMFGKSDLFEQASLKPKEKPQEVAVEAEVDFKEISPRDFEELEKESQQRFMIDALQTYGVYCESETNKVILLVDNASFLGVAKKDFHQTLSESDYEVWLMKSDWKKPKKTKYYINSQNYIALQQAYMSLYG